VWNGEVVDCSQQMQSHCSNLLGMISAVTIVRHTGNDHVSIANGFYFVDIVLLNNDGLEKISVYFLCFTISAKSRLRRSVRLYLWYFYSLGAPFKFFDFWRFFVSLQFPLISCAFQ
jgi:hypothetical protein